MSSRKHRWMAPSIKLISAWRQFARVFVMLEALRDAKDTLRIAVMLDSRSPPVRSMLGGIRQFAVGQESWRTELVDSFEALATMGQIDGLLGMIFAEQIPMGDRLPPAVSVFSNSSVPPGLRVYSDPQKGAELVAGHLLERDVQALGIVMYARMQGARRARAEAFAQAGREAGVDVAWYVVEDQKPGETESERMTALAHWLRNMPHPLGLMTGDDRLGMAVLDACRVANLKVPDDVGIVGHNNDEPICSFCQPQLSSLATDQQQIGFRAAALLDRLIRGHPPPDQPTLIPPLGIVIRGSSDMQNNVDPAVAIALRYIRDHLDENITPQDVVDRTPASASTLQRRFKKFRGQTIGEALRQARLQRVERLLLTSEQPLAVIASQTGYRYLSQLSRDFKQAYSQTPTAYRRRFRSATL